MTRAEFLRQLLPRLAALPPEEQQRAADFYNEIILDGVECGRDEAAIIAGLGGVEEVARRTLEDYAAPAAVPAYVPPKSRRHSAGGWVLVGLVWICGILLGIPLAFAALCVYLSLWAALASLFAVGGACILSGVLSVPALFFLAAEFPLPALFQLGAGLLLAGLGVLLLLGTVGLTRQFLRMTRFLKSRISRVFARKEVPYAP